VTPVTALPGLFPLALAWGEGGALNAPLARAVVGGVTASTVVLTLVVISVVLQPAGRLPAVAAAREPDPG